MLLDLVVEDSVFETLFLGFSELIIFDAVLFCTPDDFLPVVEVKSNCLGFSISDHLIFILRLLGKCARKPFGLKVHTLPTSNLASTINYYS